MNWRGRPLTSHDVIVQTIAATTTRTGPSVHAELNTTAYPTGAKIPDAQMTALRNTGALRATTGTSNGTPTRPPCPGQASQTASGFGRHQDVGDGG